MFFCKDCKGEKKTKEAKYCKKCSYNHRPSGLKYNIKVVNKGWIKKGDRRNLGIKRSEEYKRAMSERSKGIRRSIITEFKRTNGNGYRHLLYKGVLSQICKYCGETNIKRLQVHHIDEDRSNNSLDNLTVLCRPCHLALHGRQERVYVEGRKQVNFL